MKSLAQAAKFAAKEKAKVRGTAKGKAPSGNLNPDKR